LSAEDRLVFERAMRVKDDLDGYHGRASFDDRNIEDILSILSFNTMEKTKSNRDSLKWINDAISRTIDLSCTVKHDGSLNRITGSGPDVYKTFWVAIFNWVKAGNPPPTIITFNYDLVLERALFQVLVNVLYNRGNPPFPQSELCLSYYYELFESFSYAVRYIGYYKENLEQSPGTTLELTANPVSENLVTFELIKLHGSLNFPKAKVQGGSQSPVIVIEDPFISPPIYDKAAARYGSKMWTVALQRLRETKNIVFVGYSFPKTDIYMQYFIKVAIGPNINLNRIFVFDPALYASNAEAQGIRDRYESCFAEQLRQRIEFRPNVNIINRKKEGTFEDFVNILLDSPNTVLF